MINAKKAVELIAAIAIHHQLTVNYDELIIRFSKKEKIRPSSIGIIANYVGLKAKSLRFSHQNLSGLNAKNYPGILVSKEGEMLLLVAKKDENVFVVAHYEQQVAKLSDTSLDELSAFGFEQLFLLGPKKESSAHGSFGFAWILQEALKYRATFIQIALISIILNFMAMGVPIYSQIVVDKVLSQRNMATLAVLTLGVGFLVIFEIVFSVLRQYLMMVVTNKVDLQLSRSAFQKLVSLPISYFEKRPVGLVARNVQQIHEVRNFLTGTLLFTLLDTFSAFIFIPVLFYYSIKLATVILLLGALIGLTILTFLKPYNDRLLQVSNAESKKQGMLIESITGIRTIKSLALELSQQHAWDSRVAKSINQSFALSKLGLIAVTIVDFIQKNLSIIIICVGSFDVIDSQLTVGGLIAFLMLSGRVVGSLAGLAGFVNAFQQAKVSIGLIAEIMDHPVESRKSGIGALPVLKGGISFENVSFSYPGSSIVVLKEVNFSVKPGELIGIVGKSGSGKSTISKLMQRLYEVKVGSIRYDGIDIGDVDLFHLRKNIGIVMQDNFMFNLSVLDNIRIANPSMSMDEVVAATMVAGAYDFIQNLEHGFDTILEEGGANLSGGQRQRLGIARAIVNRPRLLILDEATSALDPETESQFMHNLSSITVDRTVIIISHRLSTLTRCDRILVLNDGKIDAFDSHNQLLHSCEVYRNLWEQQNY